MFSDDPVVRARLSEALETVLNKTQEPNKSKKVQHSNAKNAVLFEAINLILHFQGWEQLFSILILACYWLYTPTCTIDHEIFVVKKFSSMTFSDEN